MVQLSVIEAQLTKLGVRKTWFCRPELRELQHILMDNERIVHCVVGRYSGGFAVLIATEMRLLLIDKKPLYLTVEDIRYDMISEVDVSSRLFDATVTVFTVNRQLAFSSTRQGHLRELVKFVQQRVMEIRQYGQEVSQPMQIFQPQVTQIQPAPAQQSITDAVTQQLAAHMPHPHVPEPIVQAVSHTREYIPEHLSQAVGSTAYKLASRLHHNNPYTKGPLMMRRHWSSWSHPS